MGESNGGNSINRPPHNNQTGFQMGYTQSNPLLKLKVGQRQCEDEICRVEVAIEIPIALDKR